MYIKFVPELFLEVAELERFRESLDESGFRKNVLDNSVSFGLIKSAADPLFLNSKVERDTDNSLGQKTIKIAAVKAINSDGLFLINDAITGIPVPADSNWYWIKIAHQYSSQENGTVNIDVSGNITGVGTEFTKILRGMPNFPSRIKFINSVGNTLEYDILDVTDDTHAVAVHPAITVGGDAEFIAETNINYQIVGTFSAGMAVPNQNKFPFQYDSVSLEIVPEVTANTKPAYTIGQEFYIARVRIINGALQLQDKRLDYWGTKGSDLAISIDRNDNPLVGVEAVKWENSFNTGDRNIVEVAWGMRSSNWSVDTAQRIVTLLGSATGGSFKDVSDFSNGDFDGWRVYSSNGRYRRVISSIKQGSAINLYLDVLDVDDYSTDGGDTILAQELLVVPNCDRVSIAFNGISTPNVNEVFTFPVNTSVAKCLVTVYDDPTCLYNVQYRYASFKEYTDWKPIVSGEFYNEASYDDKGVITITPSVTTYTSDQSAGFIELTISPTAYKNFRDKVDKGDLIGVRTITSFVTGQVLDLKVGVDKRYQHITGNISLGGDVYISLSHLLAITGNEFRIHLDCTSLVLGGNNIIIVDNYASGSINALKTIGQGDVFCMQNQDGGLVFDCVFDELGKWLIYQNYDIGQPFSMQMFEGALDDYFDTQSGAGKVKGYFGWRLHSILNQGRVPVGFGTHTDNYAGGLSQTTVFAVGASGGEVKHQQLAAEVGKHVHHIPGATGSDDGSGAVVARDPNTVESAGNTDPNLTAEATPMNIMQPFYVTAFIKREY